MSNAAHPSITTPYDVNDAEFIRDRELARLRAQCALFWEKEHDALKAAGMRDGGQLLEVGSGPGYVTQRLTRAFPASRITCVELDPSLIAEAKSLFDDRSAPGPSLISGSITEVDLPSHHFDACYARLVFQHLPDPLLAARRIFEALRPGGMLAIMDIDIDLLGIIDPMPQALMNLIMKREEFIARRGSNRRIGRQLWNMLKQVGFEQMQLQLVVAHTDEKGIDAFKEEFDLTALAPLVALGVVSEAEMSDAQRAITEFLNNQPYMLVPLFMVSGRKPA